MTVPVLWIVNPDNFLCVRWEKLVRQQGWKAFTASDLQGFLAACSRNTVGLALIDWVCFVGVGPAGSRAGSTSSHATVDKSNPESLGAVKTSVPDISVILTAGVELSNVQVISMLEAGADDYLLNATPQDLLLARLKTHLRRLLPSMARSMDLLEAPGGDIRLDRARHQLWLRRSGGRWISDVSLTSTELRLLALLLERPGTVLDRRFIVEALWRDDGESIRLGTVDKHIESLRRKLRGLGRRIQTIYGVGYAYREQE